MNGDSLSKRYAIALLERARDKGEIEVIEEEVRSLLEFLEKDRSLLSFLQSPDVLDSHKRALVETVFHEKVSRSLLEFLLLLFKRRRVYLLEKACKEFELLAERARGIERARVLTASKLEAAQRSALKIVLEKVTGKSIILKEEVDPGLVGGAVVIVHNKVVDDSVRAKLDGLRESLLSARVH